MTSHLSKCDFRAMTLSMWKQSLSPVKIHVILLRDHGKHAPVLRTIQRWIARFNAGDESLNHKPHTGRPVSAVTYAYVSTCEQLLKDNPCMTIRDISASSGISVFSVQTIIHEKLGMKKICSRWVPHKLTDEQKAQRVASAKEMLKLFHGNHRNRLSDIVTGDGK